MTVLTILSPEEIKLFEKPPKFTAAERKVYFSLPKWAEEVIETLKTTDGKICFLLQLGYFRATKKFYQPAAFPEADIVHVARRLLLPVPGNLWGYPKATMHRHRTLIREKLGVSAFTEAAEAILVKETDLLLAKQLRLKNVFGECLAKLEQLKIEVPHYYRLADLITGRFRSYEKQLLLAIEENLAPSDKALLDRLLKTDPGYALSERAELKIKRYGVTLLKRPNQSTKPAKIKSNIDDLLILRELFDKLKRPIAALPLSPDIIWHYATVVIKTQIFQIARRDEKRYLYLLCFIIHQYYSLQDLLLDIILKVGQTADNKARRAQKETYFTRRADRGGATATLTNAVEEAEKFKTLVSQIVLSQAISDTEKVKKLAALVREDQEGKQEKTKTALALLKRENGLIERNADYYEALEGQSRWMQKRASEIVRTVGFNRNTSRRALVEAIDHFVATGGRVGEHPPITFLSQKERQNVKDQKYRIRISLYKMLLFRHIAESTKSGGLNLKHSYRYRSLDEYMISKEDWLQNRTEYLKRANLEKFSDCEAVMTDLERKLDAQFRQTNERVRTGENRYLVLFGDHQFSLSTPKQDTPTEVFLDLFPKSRFVPLCEVLATINRVTGFLSHLYPHSAYPCARET